MHRTQQRQLEAYHSAFHLTIELRPSTFPIIFTIPLRPGPFHFDWDTPLPIPRLVFHTNKKAGVFTPA